MKKLYIFYFCTWVILSCRHDDKSDLLPQKSAEYNFLCLSHTYARDIDHLDLDSATKQISFDKYDLLLLGGDLLENTTLYSDTFQWLNSIFHLDDPATLWAFGNHDYDNIQLATSITGRLAYYAKYFNGITFLVLDTQDSLSNFRGDQLQLIKNVTDTITSSAYLVVLMHKLVWMVDGGILESHADSVCNGGLGTCFFCNNPNNFYTDVYPRMVTLESRGVNVLFIGGDIGLKVQKYEYLSHEGVRFIATGLCSGCAVNYGLKFKWIPDEKNLSYEYVLVDELAE